MTSDTSQLDRSVRQQVYDHIVAQEEPPSADQVAAAVGCLPEDVRAAYRRLAEDHVLVLDPDSGAIRMAMPFSGVPTRFMVSVGGKSWWANCAWDALGIAVALGKDASIQATCGDCDEPITLAVEAGQLKGDGGLIHFAVPAARWWDDIVFT
jgi:hypothetical protein